MTEQIGTSPKKPRGRSPKSLKLIEAMYVAAEKAQPITGRGIGYKMFVAKLIPDMSRKSMRVIYRLLKDAREDSTIPWSWIVDETRQLEPTATWSNTAAFVRTMRNGYRRDFWDQQPHRVEVWSEKGTVRGVLAPVLDEYGVGFRVLHGFTSATEAYGVAQDDDGRPLIALYCGDWDPSGMCMSEHDIPKRMEKYDGGHVDLRRVALRIDDVQSLPAFPAADKAKDPRHKWFVARYGNECWELDAMDPNDLRARIEQEIEDLIEPVAWGRCEVVNKAEQESLREVLDRWGRPPPPTDFPDGMTGA
jgi:hypothetical protein